MIEFCGERLQAVAWNRQRKGTDWDNTITGLRREVRSSTSSVYEGQRARSGRGTTSVGNNIAQFKQESTAYDMSSFLQSAIILSKFASNEPANRRNTPSDGFLPSRGAGRQ